MAVDPPPKTQYERQYNSVGAAVDPPPKPQYERQRLDDLDFRSAVKDMDVQGDCRERGWSQHSTMAEKPHQEFRLPARETVEHASSIRSLYEGEFLSSASISE